MDRDDFPTIICAWCGGVIVAGGPVISHGICVPCAARLEAALESEPATGDAGARPTRVREAA